MASAIDNYLTAAKGGDGPDHFVFCSSSREHALWLRDALRGWKVVQQEIISVDQLLNDIAAASPRLVLLDFSGNCADNLSKVDMNLIALAQTLRLKASHRTLVAVGTTTYPEGAIAALRAGINHFIDMSASPSEAREIVRKIISAAPEPRLPKSGIVIALLGSRAGIGTTTLAVHLADLLGSYRGADGRECGVCLLDLGLPAGDGQLYLNTSGSFSFADTLDSRQRLDPTLIQTAMTRSGNGVTIVPLPQQLSDMQRFSDAEAISLLTQLRHYFDVLVMDLGGHIDNAFAIKMANASDHLWLVTDQSAGALVSLAVLLKKLGKRDADVRDRQLIVNRHDKQYGMIAPQIAERFNLPLAAQIPDRTLSLMNSANQGKLLHEVSPGDAYVQAVESLTAQAIKRMAGDWNTERRSRWTPGFILKMQQRSKTETE